MYSHYSNSLNSLDGEESDEGSYHDAKDASAYQSDKPNSGDQIIPNLDLQALDRSRGMIYQPYIFQQWGPDNPQLGSSGPGHANDTVCASIKMLHICITIKYYRNIPYNLIKVYEKLIKI